jgi:hypothetical protein
VKRLAIAGLLSLVACGYPPEGPAPKPLTPPELQAAASRYSRLGVPPEAIDDGEKLFAARCNGCHHYPDRDAFSEAQWPVILNRMAKKAKLRPEQQDNVLHYLLATRKAAPAP